MFTKVEEHISIISSNSERPEILKAKKCAWQQITMAYNNDKGVKRKVSFIIFRVPFFIFRELLFFSEG